MIAPPFLNNYKTENFGLDPKPRFNGNIIINYRSILVQNTVFLQFSVFYLIETRIYGQSKNFLFVFIQKLRCSFIRSLATVENPFLMALLKATCCCAIIMRFFTA